MRKNTTDSIDCHPVGKAGPKPAPPAGKGKALISPKQKCDPKDAKQPIWKINAETLRKSPQELRQELAKQIDTLKKETG